MVHPTRRALVGTAGALLVGASSALGQDATRVREPVRWSRGTEPPARPLPPGATDCHHHIYDGRFPVAAGVASKPADATASDYLRLQARLGTSRHVAVQPSAYGTDNSCLVDALAQFGTASARGVAVVDTSVTDAELKRLDAAGVRGIRFNFAPAGATTPDMMAPLARRIADLGWHVQLHAGADGIVALSDTLRALACPLVIDHLGHVPQPSGLSHPVFGLVRGLLDAGRTWVKVSAIYADTKVGPPDYADTGTVASAYLRAAPERVVWGSDWPHPSEAADNKPDDARLVDLLTQWAPDDRVRQLVLVGNPATLYGFS